MGGTCLYSLMAPDPAAARCAICQNILRELGRPDLGGRLCRHVEWSAGS